MLRYEDRKQVEEDLCLKLEQDVKRAVRHFTNVAQMVELDNKSVQYSIGATLLTLAVDWTALTTVATPEQFGEAMQTAMAMTRKAEG